MSRLSLTAEADEYSMCGLLRVYGQGVEIVGIGNPGAERGAEEWEGES